jgi:hypothetical protein
MPFDENWYVMVRTGYETNIFREAINLFGDVLKKNYCSTNNSKSKLKIKIKWRHDNDKK